MKAELQTRPEDSELSTAARYSLSHHRASSTPAESTQEFNTAYVFISHNLAVVRHVADHVMVMYLGRPVEMGPKEDIYTRPMHPYTQALLSATPTIHPDPDKPKIKIVGELPNPLNPPSGCAFHKRCPYATERCSTEEPALRLLDSRQVACHYAADINY